MVRVEDCPVRADSVAGMLGMLEATLARTESAMSRALTETRGQTDSPEGLPDKEYTRSRTLGRLRALNHRAITVKDQAEELCEAMGIDGFAEGEMCASPAECYETPEPVRATTKRRR